MQKLFSLRMVMILGLSFSFAQPMMAMEAKTVAEESLEDLLLRGFNDVCMGYLEYDKDLVEQLEAFASTGNETEKNIASQKITELKNQDEYYSNMLIEYQVGNYQGKSEYRKRTALALWIANVRGNYGDKNGFVKRYDQACLKLTSESKGDRSKQGHILQSWMDSLKRKGEKEKRPALSATTFGTTVIHEEDEAFDTMVIHEDEDQKEDVGEGSREKIECLLLYQRLQFDQMNMCLQQLQDQLKQAQQGAQDQLKKAQQEAFRAEGETETAKQERDYAQSWRGLARNSRVQAAGGLIVAVALYDKIVAPWILSTAKAAKEDGFVKKLGMFVGGDGETWQNGARSAYGMIVGKQKPKAKKK